MARPWAVLRVAGLALGILAAAWPSPAQTPQQRSRQFRRFTEPTSPVILAGDVVLEDGSPPPEPVLVERVCIGRPPIREGYTNSKGRFSIELGRDSSAGVDVEYDATGAANRLAGGATPSNQMIGCELRASLPGFSSDAIDLSTRRVMDNPRVGTIVLRPLEGVTGTIFSRTAMRASQEARRAFEKGHELASKEKLDQAREEYEKAVRLHPGFATAWYELGLVHEMQHQVGDARAAYREAVAADPGYIKPYRQLSALAFKEQRWEEVAETAGRIVELDPVSYPAAHFYNAAASYFIGEFATAERSARAAIELDPGKSIPNARYVLGVILLQNGDLAGARESLREYVEMSAPGPDVERAKSLLEPLEATDANPP